MILSYGEPTQTSLTLNDGVHMQMVLARVHLLVLIFRFHTGHANASVSLPRSLGRIFTHDPASRGRAGHPGDVPDACNVVQKIRLGIPGRI